MKLHCHRLLALILSLSFGGHAWAGGGNGSVSVAPPCQRTDCRPGHTQAVRVQGALLQAAALSVASASLGPQGRARPTKGLPRRSQTRLPSWYKRSLAAQLRGQSTAVAARVPQKMPARARVREAAASHPGRHSRRATGPAADIPDLTILSEDHERQDDPRLQAGEGEAVFGLRPATHGHPGENHIMIGNVSGNISSNHSNAPARASGGGLSHSGARAVWHAATTLSLASPRRAAPGRSGKSRTAVPTRPHEQLSVAGLRQKDVGRRKSGVRVREADGGVQVAHAGKKGKVKDRTQPARPAGGRTGSTAAAANPFESASSMKTAGPRSEARGAHHRHLVQESMDIEQDALDRQMRDLDLDDDMEAEGPDEAMGTQGEELYSAASHGEEKARERRQASGECPPVVMSALGLLCINQTGSYTTSIDTNDTTNIFILESTSLFSGSMIDVTLRNSYINTKGYINIFQSSKAGLPISLTIRNSTLISQGLITLATPAAPSTGNAMENCDINLKIEDSTLEVQEGNITLIRADDCKKAPSKMDIQIDDKSKLIATNGNINLVDSLNSTNLDIKIKDSDLHTTNGNVVLVQDSSGLPSNMTLSMNNSNLMASGTPRNGQTVLQAVPVGSVRGENQKIRIENSHGNTIEAKLTPGASGVMAIAHMGWGPTCGGLNGSTLQQSQLMNNRVLASGHTAYASLAGVYSHDANCTSNHSWHLEQSELDDNSVVASAGQGTSLASLGFVYDDDQRLGSVVFDINQEDCRNNTVAAESDSSRATASLTLAEAREGSRNFENACISAVHAGYKADSDPVQVALYQCGMDENQLNVSSTGQDASRSLLVSGGCLIFPLSVSGTGDIRCTGRSCQDVSPVYGSILTQTDCQVLACGDQTPCTQGSLDAPGARLENPDAAACADGFFSGVPRFSACKANGTSEDSTSSAPGEPSDGDNLAALGSLALLLPASCGALMTIGVCAAYHNKKRQKKAEYPVQDVTAMESRFVGEQAACEMQAAAEPSAVQWRKGDGSLDSASDEEPATAKENLYEGVKGSPSAHF